ncbi:MAG TPA: hypothetical protein VGA37_09965 [Gemmatimonadales bacterium]
MNCYACQAEVSEGTRFCPECGQPLPFSRPADGDMLAEFDLTAFTELRDRKAALAAELEGMLERIGERELTEDERNVWAQLYGEWHRVAEAITATMQRFSERVDRDRRTGPTRQRERRRGTNSAPDPDRRDETDRRQGDRRSMPDRRDPFGRYDW